jgi:hypothetical protein
MADEAQLTRSFSTLLSKKAGNAIARKFGGETGNSLTAHLISGAINTGAGMAVGGVVGGIAGAVDENSDIGTGVETGMTLGAVAGAGYSLGTSMLMESKQVSDEVMDIAATMSGSNGASNLDGKGLQSKTKQSKTKEPSLIKEAARKVINPFVGKAKFVKNRSKAYASKLQSENNIYEAEQEAMIAADSVANGYREQADQNNKAAEVLRNREVL